MGGGEEAIMSRRPVVTSPTQSFVTISNRVQRLADVGKGNAKREAGRLGPRRKRSSVPFKYGAKCKSLLDAPRAGALLLA